MLQSPHFPLSQLRRRTRTASAGPLAPCPAPDDSTENGGGKSWMSAKIEKIQIYHWYSLVIYSYTNSKPIGYMINIIIYHILYQL